MTEADKTRLIDWQVGLAATAGSQSLLCELIEIFLVEYPKYLAGIAEAIDNRSAKELRRFAHTLKGCLRYFGESKASALAYELEEMGASELFDGADLLLEELRTEVARLLPEMQEFHDAQ